MTKVRKKKVNQKKVQENTQAKNTAGGSTRMKTRKIQSKSNLQLLQMPVRLWQKLKKLVNHLLGKSKS